VTAGVPILCEKPLERDADRAAQLAAAVRGSDVVFMMAFCHRFHPPVAELKKLIDCDVLGKPLFFRSIFGGFMDLAMDHRSRPELSGGGTMIDTCSHSVDLFRFLVGEPSAVTCMIGNVGQDLPVEDCCALIVNAGGRTLGEIAASHSIPVGTNELAWYGTGGTAILEYWDKLSYQVQGEGWIHVDCEPAPDRFVREIRHFVQCIRARVTPSVTVDDGLAASRIISAAYESAANGITVELASSDQLRV
jgi:predicted dehydrogenase